MNNQAQRHHEEREPAHRARQTDLFEHCETEGDADLWEVNRLIEYRLGGEERRG